MSFKLILVHNENIQTFEVILKHLEMEQKCIKAYVHSNVAFVAIGNKPKDSGPYHGLKSKKGPYHPQPRSKGGIAKKKKGKSNGEKNIAPVKCYNRGEMGHFGRDCPEPTKVALSTNNPELYVYSHAFIDNSLP